MNSPEYKISVVIPVHNAALWLRRLLDILLDIQFPELEIITVENASTDNSYEILKDYEGRGIMVARNHDAGVSKARNTGLALATAPYIMFVDADDYIDLRLPSVLLEIMQSESADMAVCDFVYERENGEVLERNSFNEALTFENDEIYDKIVNCVVVGGYPVCKLFLSKIIKNNGLRFDEELIVHEDLLFVLQYAEYCKKIAYKPFCGYHYVRHENSANTTVSFRHSYGRLLARARVLDFLESREVWKVTQIEKINLYNYLGDAIKLLPIDELDMGQINKESRLNICQFIQTHLSSMLTCGKLTFCLKVKFVFIYMFGLNTWYAIKKIKGYLGV